MSVPDAYASYVPIALMASRHLSAAAKLVYIHALWRMNKTTRKHWYSTGRIASEMGISVSSVERSLRELSVLGAVSCRVIRQPGGNVCREVVVPEWNDTLNLRLGALDASVRSVLQAVKAGESPNEHFNLGDLPPDFPVVDADYSELCMAKIEDEDEVENDESSASVLPSPVKGTPVMGEGHPRHPRRDPPSPVNPYKGTDKRTEKETKNTRPSAAASADRVAALAKAAKKDSKVDRKKQDARSARKAAKIQPVPMRDDEVEAEMPPVGDLSTISMLEMLDRVLVRSLSKHDYTPLAAHPRRYTFAAKSAIESLAKVITHKTSMDDEVRAKTWAYIMLVFIAGNWEHCREQYGKDAPAEFSVVWAASCGPSTVTVFQHLCQALFQDGAIASLKRIEREMADPSSSMRA